MRGSQALAHCRRMTGTLYFRVSRLFRQFRMSRAAIPLCVAAAFGLVVFVDELLEFIEFGWSDALK
jgi:hypothetical protein